MQKIISVVGVAILSLIMASPAYALLPSGEATDLYVKNFEWIACDQNEINSGNDPDTKRSVVNVAPDNTYYDVLEDTSFRPIERIYCYRLTIGNKGPGNYDPPPGEPSGTRNHNFFITISPYNKVLGDTLGVESRHFQEPIMAGEDYVMNRDLRMQMNTILGTNFYVQIALDEQYNPLTHMAGEFHDLIDESDESNNTFTKKVTLESNPFPERPKNIRITHISKQNFTVGWDSVNGIDGYRVWPHRYTGAGEWLNAQETTETSAIIPLTNDDLHCAYVTTEKNGYVASLGTDVCYRRTLPKFNDVPSEEWYFGYLQKLQNGNIINGYKNVNGQLTGQFGPANTLTVAESIKIVLASMNIALDASNESLPNQLQNHWASDYFRKAKALKIKIMNDDNLDPNRAVTRGEILQMFFDSKSVFLGDSESTLSDVASSPQKKAINYAFNLGLINGYPDGTFRSNNPVNRAEIAKIAVNMMRYFSSE